jgi:hypothetical protein
MYPYQVSRVLADQRIHDMVAAVQRDELAALARSGASQREQLSHRTVVAARVARAARLSRVIAPLTARLERRDRTRAGATMTAPRRGGSGRAASGAGPMGCSA